MCYPEIRPSFLPLNLSSGHARALAEDGRAVEPLSPPADHSTSLAELSTPSTPHREPPSPGGNRKSIGGGNTTKVLADLQAGVMASRTALDNTKGQLRLSQRTVAQVSDPFGYIHTVLTHLPRLVVDAADGRPQRWTRTATTGK